MFCKRKIAVDILNQIAEIEKEVFSDAWSHESIRDSIGYDYNHFLAVTMDGKVIRDVQADQNIEIAGYILYSNLDIIELQRIAVRESCRRRGFADRMMEIFTDIEDKIILEVRSKNIPAISLYNKYGFKEISVRKNYYNNPADDAIIMERHN